MHEHIYEEAGVYDVTLQVGDWNGRMDFETKYMYIVVAGGPALGVSVSPASFDFGFMELGATGVNQGSALVVTNTGEVPDRLYNIAVVDGPAHFYRLFGCGDMWLRNGKAALKEPWTMHE